MLLKLLPKIFLLSSIIYVFFCTIPAHAQNFDLNNDGIIDSKDLETLSIFFGSNEEKYDLNTSKANTFKRNWRSCFHSIQKRFSFRDFYEKQFTKRNISRSTKWWCCKIKR